MELNPLEWILPVPQAHHLTLCSEGRDEQFRWQGLFNDQGVIASRLERVGQAIEHPTTVVEDARYLAMHEPRCPSHAPPKHVPHTLMSQADTKDGHGLVQSSDHVIGHTAIRRIPRAR